MAIFTSARRATPNEMAAEIDRRGAAIEKLEARAERAEAALREIIAHCNWQNPEVAVVSADKIARAALEAKP